MSDETKLLCERIERLERAIFEAMAQLSVADAVGHAEGGEPLAETTPIKTPSKDYGCLPAIVESVIAARKLRLKYFEDDLFFDPAWSILIDLYASQLRGQQLSVTSACYGSGVPPTTALRYISVLEHRGYVERLRDAKDKRRAYLKLTQQADRKLADYFCQAKDKLAA